MSGTPSSDLIPFSRRIGLSTSACSTSSRITGSRRAATRPAKPRPTGIRTPRSTSSSIPTAARATSSCASGSSSRTAHVSTSRTSRVRRSSDASSCSSSRCARAASVRACSRVSRSSVLPLIMSMCARKAAILPCVQSVPRGGTQPCSSRLHEYGLEAEKAADPLRLLAQPGALAPVQSPGRLDRELDPLRRLPSAPDTCTEAVDEEERRSRRTLVAALAVSRDLFAHCRRNELLPLPEAHHVHVVLGEQPDRRNRVSATGRVREVKLLQRRGTGAEPLAELAMGHRPVGGRVAVRGLLQRRGRLPPRCAPEPVLRMHERDLLTLRRTEAELVRECCVAEVVPPAGGELLARPRSDLRGDRVRELLPRQAVAAEGVADRTHHRLDILELVGRVIRSADDGAPGGRPEPEFVRGMEMQSPPKRPRLRQLPPLPERVAHVRLHDPVDTRRQLQLGRAGHLGVDPADIADDLHQTLRRRPLGEVGASQPARPHLVPAHPSRICFSVSPRSPRRSVSSGITSSGGMLPRLTDGPNSFTNHACDALFGASKTTLSVPTAAAISPISSVRMPPPESKMPAVPPSRASVITFQAPASSSSCSQRFHSSASYSTEESFEPTSERTVKSRAKSAISSSLRSRGMSTVPSEISTCVRPRSRSQRLYASSSSLT